LSRQFREITDGGPCEVQVGKGLHATQAGDETKRETVDGELPEVGEARFVPEEILPISTCRELLGGEATQLTEEDIAAVRDSALLLAEVVAQAYADFRAEAEDIDPEEIRATGSIGMAKLMGIDISAEELDDFDTDMEGSDD
jgi:hypothetical protein